MDKKKTVLLLSFIPVVIILLSTFSPEIINALDKSNPPNILKIPISFDRTYNYEAFSSQKLSEYINGFLYVPNYDAEVKITPQEGIVQVGNELLFKVTVKDKGIQPLDKPYFYVYLVDPENMLRACFPNCMFEYGKVKPWLTTLQPRGSTVSYNIDKAILPIKINQSLLGFYPDSLMAGEGIYRFEVGNVLYASKEKSQFYYSFLTDEVGTWKIYALAFNEEYLNRKSGYPLSNSVNNFVNYAENIISVKGQEVPPASKSTVWPVLVKFFAALIASVLAYRGVYGMLDKHYEKWQKLSKELYGLREQKYFYLGMVLIFIIFYVILKITL